MASTKISNQEIYDSKGFLERRKLNPREKEMGTRTWVGFDQFVQKDEDGEPVLQLVMRNRDDRPIYPKASKQNSPEAEVRRQWVPAIAY
jgi:hypothetical protein